MDNKQDLVPIAIDFLFEGMNVDNDIFNFDANVLLIPKGEVLTAHKIDRLMKFNSDKRNISVHPSTFEILTARKNEKESVPEIKIEDQIGYTEIKSSMNGFLNEVSKTNRLQKEAVHSLFSNVYEKFATADVKSLLQCIDSPRPVDENLERHCINVSILNGLMGRWLGLTEIEASILVLAGVVHDVGKTKIPANILNSTGKLTDEEFETIKKHSNFSYELLEESGFFDKRVKLAAKHHHEKINGGGYPDNLSREDIPLFAKITAVCDVYDAMVSARSYKTENSPFKILAQFEQNRFDNLDPELVAVFLREMPSQYLDLPVLMSDSTICIVRHVMPNDLEYPIVDKDGVLLQSNENWYCEKILR